MKKRILSIGLAAAMAAGILTGCGGASDSGAAAVSDAAAESGEGRTLTVFNYGEYMDPEVIAQFEDETGIKVLYEEAVTAEEMYSKYSAGAIDYDLLCTTDYMIKRLIQEGELQKIDFSTFENASNIGDEYWEIAKAFDENNEYALPYFWGTIGILYDKTLVNGPIDSWEVLFNGEYAGNLIMPDSMRDAFYVALKYLGYSLNTTDEAELQEAYDLLLAQKPDVQAYLVDEVRDEVVAGNAALGVVYSGEAYLGKEYNENLEYVVPKEGSNLWMDCWGITSKCEDTEAAQMFLDFICRDDIAYADFEYIYYSTPNTGAIELMDDSLKNDKTIIPDMSKLTNCEVTTLCDDNSLQLYNDYWKNLKSE